jgi:hypothetical protein
MLTCTNPVLVSMGRKDRRAALGYNASIGVANTHYSTV